MNSTQSRKNILFIIGVIACIQALFALLLLYSPWIPLDDPYYVLQNQHVKSGLSWKNTSWAFTTLYYGNWMPLTWLSYQMDATLYGTNSVGFHLTNILLHFCTTALFFLFLLRATNSWWPSALCALLFSIHPLHIEPVAWVSSRKDLLAGLTWMISLISYAHYSKSPNIKRYLGLIFTLCLALISKPSTITLPAVFLVMDFWPLRKLSIERSIPRLITEKIPFFLLSTLVLIGNFIGASSSGIDISSGYLSLSQRLINAGRFLGDYATRGFYPLNLAIEYPHPLTNHFSIQNYLALLAIALVFFLALRLRRSAPWILAGLFWFLCSISLNLQLMQVGNQATADRHMYIPLAGLLILLCWSIYSIPKKAIATSIALVLLASYSLISLSLAQAWRTPEALFQRAATLYPTATNAWIYLGDYYRHNHQYQNAATQYQTALEYNPEKIQAFLRLHYLVRDQKITADYGKWLKFSNNSEDSLSYTVLISRSMMLSYAAGANCTKQKQPCALLAKQYLLEASKQKPLAPQTIEATHLLAVHYYQSKEWGTAIELFEKVRAANPNRIDAQLLLAHCYLMIEEKEKTAELLTGLKQKELSTNQREQLEYLLRQIQ